MARFLLTLFACVVSVAAQSVMVRNSMMNGNAGQPQTAETSTTAMGPNGETISISIGITIISSSQGGSSETTMMGSPTMAVGMTHQVCRSHTLDPTIVFIADFMLGYSWWQRRTGLHAQLYRSCCRRYGPV